MKKSFLILLFPLILCGCGEEIKPAPQPDPEPSHVCVDADKTNWATTVKAQKLPWINVCDGLAEYSQAPAIYNITSIPTIYIFDAQGNIIDKQIFEKSRILSVLSRIL